jgi:hypothetical protein
MIEEMIRKIQIIPLEIHSFDVAFVACRHLTEDERIGIVPFALFSHDRDELVNSVHEYLLK